MRTLIVLFVLLVGVGWYWGYHKEDDFFIYDPVQSEELDFENPYSEDIYTHCVHIENMILKANNLNGCPVNSETYPGLLKDAKAFCRCIATNHALLKTHLKYVMNVHRTKDAYKKVLAKTSLTCEHLKRFK